MPPPIESKPTSPPSGDAHGTRSALSCPCGSGAPLDACCGPLHRGERYAPTAVALMRSRYAAFTLADADYLYRTVAPKADATDASRSSGATDAERRSLTEWSKRVSWLGLTIDETQEGREGDATGEVAFTARYLEDGNLVLLRERSRFARDAAGHWLYLDGEPTTETKRLGRNEPCPCGSGKKLKACHGGR